eukprot:TRINITY_DN17061_c0_g1_i2.p1 TRINITY_DN17061_c0_g1~~TRINITY_DN17061_c0_g1_i2.p1  ORF type:complete len:247 (+),score=63.07 TRINITY_DN17061_c0_g1_i2:60-743(+)
MCIRDRVSTQSTWETLGASVVEEVSLPEHLLAPILFTSICGEGCYKSVFEGNAGSVGMKGLYLPSLMKAMAKWRTSADQLSKTGKLFVLLGAYTQSEFDGIFYGKSQNLGRMLRDAYNQKLKEYDVLIMPSVPVRATPLPAEGCSFDEYMAAGLTGLTNTSACNITGHPAINLPVAKIDDRPIGMMIIGRHFEEATILKAAYAWEQANDWRKINAQITFKVVLHYLR